jgi:hypothetical protein
LSGWDSAHLIPWCSSGTAASLNARPQEAFFEFRIGGKGGRVVDCKLANSAHPISQLRRRRQVHPGTLAFLGARAEEARGGDMCAGGIQGYRNDSAAAATVLGQARPAAAALRARAGIGRSAGMRGALATFSEKLTIPPPSSARSGATLRAAPRCAVGVAPGREVGRCGVTCRACVGGGVRSEGGLYRAARRRPVKSSLRSGRPAAGRAARNDFFRPLGGSGL